MNTEHDPELQAAVARLPQHIEPPRDLWPGIAARISQQRRSRPLWAYGLAASLLLAVGAGGMWLALAPRGVFGLSPTSAAVSATDDEAYFTERATYAEDSVENSPNLAPATRALILRNLRAIEGSMRDIRLALDQDPNNTRLRSLLLDLYQDEARLLAAAQQTRTQNNVRTDL
jgi:hypothetical protein